MPALLETLRNASIPSIIFWSAALALLLAYIFKRPETLTLRRDKTGRLQIKRTALNRIIEHAAEENKDIVTARAEVTRKRDQFHIRLRLTARPDANLDTLQTRLTETVTALFRDKLGHKAETHLTLKIQNILPASKN